MKRSQLEKYIKEAIKKAMSGVPTHADEFDDSSSQYAIGLNSGGDMGTHSGISQLEEDNKEIVQYEGKSYTIEGGGADRYKIKLVDPNQTTRLNGELPFWVRKDEVTKKTNEISQLESYIKEAINGYLNGSPWSHGIAVGHKINKYNDPELIKSRYDDAAKDGFKGRPKGRLSNPRGYSLNEGCNCGCGGCETPKIEEACWDDYKIGSPKTKISSKTGKRVNNCVPMEEDNINDMSELEEDMSINEVLLLEIDENITEAKFKGKTVKLNKPMRGDSKKFKVYVNSGKKNADGSIKVKKVNFGHGGTSAKRPTMRIRKSNPKRRKAFRARHRCDNPGPNTMARYWSCKKW